MLQRIEYVNKFKESMWNGNVKVITGLRRCGKSTLLFNLFYNYLKLEKVDDNHIIKIQLDKREFLKFRNPIALCEYIEDIVKNKEDKFYLFLDEVQMAKNVVVKNEYGEDVVTIYDMLNELNGYSNLDVYVTGSNSKMLSSDIATEFRGRSTQIQVYPLSFKELYDYYGGDENKLLDDYMLFGGMPFLTTIKSKEEKMRYLKDLFNETYLKDLKEHNKIQKENILSLILDYLASTISSLTNPNNIANSIKSVLKEKIDANLVSSYIDKLEDAFLISGVKRYDVKGKTYFSFPNKYYYTDIGLRNIRLNYRQFDKGHIMENIIYNELIRRGYQVDVGVVYDRRKGQNVQKEIDFIVNDLDKKVYIQSAFEMENDNKENAELDSLALTGDFYKKIVIRNDIPHHFYDDKGFFHCNLMDFLLQRVDLF